MAIFYTASVYLQSLKTGYLDFILISLNLLSQAYYTYLWENLMQKILDELNMQILTEHFDSRFGFDVNS